MAKDKKLKHPSRKQDRLAETNGIHMPKINGELKAIVEGIDVESIDAPIIVSPCDECLTVKCNSGEKRVFCLWYDKSEVRGYAIDGQNKEVHLAVKCNPKVKDIGALQGFLVAAGSSRRPVWLTISNGRVTSVRFDS